jgi:hypothetical protein
MIECTNCGAQLRPSARICIKCGQAVNRELSNSPENVTPNTAGISQEASAALPPAYSSAATGTTTAAPVFDTPITPSINTHSAATNSTSANPTPSLEVNIPFTQTQKIIMIVSTVIFVLCLVVII